MKNKNLVIIGAVVLVVVTVVYMLVRQGGKGSLTEKITGEDQPFSGTLKAAVAMGVPMKCNYTVAGNEYEGYVQGEKFMGKFDAEGKTASLIMKDNCIWSWEEGSAQGIKTCFESSEEDGSIWDMQDSTGAGSINTDMNYTCRPAVITDDKFTPPSDVSFFDLDKMMGGELSTEEMENYLKQFENIGQ